MNSFIISHTYNKNWNGVEKLLNLHMELRNFVLPLQAHYIMYKELVADNLL